MQIKPLTSKEEIDSIILEAGLEIKDSWSVNESKYILFKGKLHDYCLSVNLIARVHYCMSYEDCSKVKFVYVGNNRDDLLSKIKELVEDSISS